jgi:predicted glutamine amidotransferase
MTDPLLGLPMGESTALVVVKDGQIIWAYHYPQDDEEIYFEPLDDALDVAYAEGADDIATVKISSTIYAVESRHDLDRD